MLLETTTEAAKRLGLTRPTVRTYILDGILDGVLIGRQAFVCGGAEPDKDKVPPRGWYAHKKQRAGEIAKIADEIS